MYEVFAITIGAMNRIKVDLRSYGYNLSLFVVFFFVTLMLGKYKKNGWKLKRVSSWISLGLLKIIPHLKHVNWFWLNGEPTTWNLFFN